MTNPIRYAILDDASDEANLWELPWNAINENGVEIHPRRTVEEVRLVRRAAGRRCKRRQAVDHSGQHQMGKGKRSEKQREESLHE